MKRFILSPRATEDVDEIIAYIDSLPEEPGVHLGQVLQETIYDLARHPEHGHVHERYSSLAGEEIRRFVANDYLFFYAARIPIVFTAILHGKRDIDSIMQSRFK